EVDQRDSGKEHDQPGTDGHRALPAEMQEQLVKAVPVSEIEDQQQRAEGHGPGSDHGAIACDPGVGVLVPLLQVRGQGRNKKQAGGKAAEKQVVDNQNAPLDLRHEVLLKQVINLWTVA